MRYFYAVFVLQMLLLRLSQEPHQVNAASFHMIEEDPSCVYVCLANYLQARSSCNGDPVCIEYAQAAEAMCIFECDDGNQANLKCSPYCGQCGFGIEPACCCNATPMCQSGSCLAPNVCGCCSSSGGCSGGTGAGGNETLVVRRGSTFFSPQSIFLVPGGHTHRPMCQLIVEDKVGLGPLDALYITPAKTDDDVTIETFLNFYNTFGHQLDCYLISDASLLTWLSRPEQPEILAL